MDSFDLNLKINERQQSKKSRGDERITSCIIINNQQANKLGRSKEPTAEPFS
jgi:hypothetical protein